MATKIVTKNSSTASAVPTASDLVQGELAVNVADKRLFTEDNTGTIVELGTNPSTIDINAGSIDGTAIGASSASTGAFTTLTATGLTVDTNTLYVDSTNNRVGIGTSSPSTELHVDGSITYDGRLRPHSTASDGSAAVPAIVVGYDYDTGLYHPASNTIGFSTGGSERMRIDSSGNVGIGTSSPTFKLDVAGNARANYFALRANESAPSESAFVYRPATGVLGFGTSSAERMRIDASGNLNIGTTGDVTSTNAGVQLRADNTIRVAKSGLAAMSIYRHTNNGSIINFYRDATNVGSISVTSSSTSYNTSSDYRLKENVVELTGATERLKQLNPSRFNFIADADTTVDGFLAHEVADVVPEAISGEKDAVDAEGNPEYQGIDQSKLVPLLVATIQELEARITELENN